MSIHTLQNLIAVSLIVVAIGLAVLNLASTPDVSVWLSALLFGVVGAGQLIHSQKQARQR